VSATTRGLSTPLRVKCAVIHRVSRRMVQGPSASARTGETGSETGSGTRAIVPAFDPMARGFGRMIRPLSPTADR
jgi:hypothetical protein